jgi:2-polyprenyl-3-methyl-5-hydroxy-6-metoxy-1,4-benzoquinol methylase
MKIIKEKFVPTKYYKEAITSSRDSIIPTDKNLLEWYKNYSVNHTNRLAFDLEYLVSKFPNKEQTNILEIGAVPPILTLAIKNAGYSIKGLDINPNRFETSINKYNLDIIKGSLGKNPLNFRDESFDAILMNEVFEHLNSNLIEVFNDLKRILKPNGKIFISTPNLKSLIGIKNFLLKGKAYSCCGELFEEYDKIQKYGHMGHVREYTPTEVKNFLIKLNFEVENIIYRGKHPIKYRILDVLIPQGRPFFSIIANKK